MGPPLELLFSIASGMIVAMIGTAVLLGAIELPMLALRSLWSRLDQTPLGRHGHFQNRTFRKTANVVLLTLALFAILYWGDQFGTLDSDRSVNLRRRRIDQTALGRRPPLERRPARPAPWSTSLLLHSRTYATSPGNSAGPTPGSC